MVYTIQYLPNSREVELAVYLVKGGASLLPTDRGTEYGAATCNNMDYNIDGNMLYSSLTQLSDLCYY